MSYCFVYVRTYLSSLPFGCRLPFCFILYATSCDLPFILSTLWQLSRRETGWVGSGHMHKRIHLSMDLSGVQPQSHCFVILKYLCSRRKCSESCTVAFTPSLYITVCVYVSLCERADGGGGMKKKYIQWFKKKCSVYVILLQLRFSEIASSILRIFMTRKLNDLKFPWSKFKV